MSGLLNWDMGDGFTIDASNEFSYDYSMVGNKTVKVFKGTATGPENITQIHMDGDNLVGVLDLSSLSNLNFLEVQNNRKLTSIINPSLNNQNWSGYQAYDCSLSGILDVSNLKIGGNFMVQGNGNLISILNPSSGNTISNYWASDCDLTGTLDMSRLSKLGGTVIIANNRKLTTIINPASTQQISNYWVYDNSLSGILDVSGFTNFSQYGSLSAYGNSGITKILFAENAMSLSSMKLSNCNIMGILDVSNFTLGGSNAEFTVSGNRNLVNIIHKASSQKLLYEAYDCSLTGTLDVSCLTGLYYTIDLHGNPALTKLILPDTLNHRDLYIFDTSQCSLDTESIDAIYSKLSSLWDSSTPIGGTFINTSGGLNSPPTNSSMNADVQKILTIFDASSLGGAVTITMNDGLTELMNFDGNFWFSVAKSVSTGIDYKVSFDCYLDVSKGNAGTWGNYIVFAGGLDMGIKFIGNNTTRNGKIFYHAKASTIRYECPMVAPNEKHHFDLYYNNSSNDVSLYVNNIIQTKTVSSESGGSGGIILVGGLTTSSPSNCKNCTLWNLDLNGEHFYEGEPAGNTEAAWADTIGTWDLSISKYTAAGDPSIRYAIFGTTTVTA